MQSGALVAARPVDDAGGVRHAVATEPTDTRSDVRLVGLFMRRCDVEAMVPDRFAVGCEAA
jgi:hypothetical protein